MSTIETRAALHQMIDNLDGQFLKAVHLVVSAYQSKEDEIVGYRIGDGAPVYKSALAKELDESVERVRAGEFITLEDLEKEAETW